jgi:hypothetical protein
MRKMRVYKIVSMEKGNLNWLFHGNHGTRRITQNVWIDAQIRENAIDGKGSSYKSGFHTLESLSDLIDYAKRFKNRDRLVIVECEIGGEIWDKTKSKHPVLLSSKIKVGKIVVSEL